MKKGALRELFNSTLQETGNDQEKAGNIASARIERLLNEKKVTPESFNFVQMASELIPNFDTLDRNDAKQVASAVRSSQFPTFSRVVLHSAIISSYESHMEGTERLVTELNATRTTHETLGGFTDLETPEMRLEGMSYEETNFGEKDVTVYMADFGRSISITREALFNDRTGQLLRIARGIGEKGGMHRAKMIIQTLEVQPRTAFKEPTGGSKAFVYKGTAYQASSFYAADHTSLDGRVNANLKTTNELVDYTDIQAALMLSKAMKDYNGDEIVTNPKIILVPVLKEATLWQILNGGSFTPVGTAGTVTTVHTGNPYGRGGMATFEPLASRYLSADTVWYMGDFAKQMIWLWVYKPKTESLAASNDRAFFNNVVVDYKFSYHGGCGHEDYLHIIKSTN